MVLLGAGSCRALCPIEILGRWVVGVGTIVLGRVRGPSRASLTMDCVAGSAMLVPGSHPRRRKVCATAQTRPVSTATVRSSRVVAKSNVALLAGSQEDSIGSGRSYCGPYGSDGWVGRARSDGSVGWREWGFCPIARAHRGPRRRSEGHDEPGAVICGAAPMLRASRRGCDSHLCCCSRWVSE